MQQTEIDQIIKATSTPNPTMLPPITNPSYMLSSLYVLEGEGVGSGTGIGVGVGVGSGVGTGMVPFDVSFEGIVSLLGGIGIDSLICLFPK